jgi:hypothetical protein
MTDILCRRYNWSIILPAELSAASVLIGFWNKEINPAVWITVCMIVVLAINLLGAGELFFVDYIHIEAQIFKAPTERLSSSSRKCLVIT